MTDAVEIHIYSDGGYFEKQDIGGWGSVIFKQDQELARLSDWQKHTSSLEMELKAAERALKATEALLQQEQVNLSEGIDENIQITLHTDSRILIEGLTQKIHLWRQNAWVHKSGNRVKYQALWESLENLTQRYQVNWQWVKGHNGNLGNTIADTLAREAATERKFACPQL